MYHPMFSPEIMVELRIVPGMDCTGEGISKGLARGLLVYFGDCNLTGEGMGIGSIALRDHEFTFFSRSWKDTCDGAVISRTYFLDTRMVWGFRGRPSLLLTRWIESFTGAYMLLPRLQEMLMKPVVPLRVMLDIHPIFEVVDSRGTVTFSYHVTPLRVKVEVRVHTPLIEGDTLCLMNELSAAWFTAGWDNGNQVPPPPGWEKCPQGVLPLPLFDPVHGIRFFLDQPGADVDVPLTLFRGREQSRDLSWAGFCIELGPFNDSREVPVVSYAIVFETGEPA